jgi:hypothetical protein
MIKVDFTPNMLQMPIEPSTDSATMTTPDNPSSTCIKSSNHRSKDEGNTTKEREKRPEQPWSIHKFVSLFL